MHKYNEISARNKIEKNGGYVGDKQIKIKNPGLAILGAIDYLVNHCGYKWMKG